MDKRYYWLKLFDDFFDSLRMKTLRRLPRGDTYLIIYLKMQLLAMKHQGKLLFKHVGKDIISELSLDLGEHPLNIRKTLEYLGGCGLAFLQEDGGYYLPYAVKNTGSEAASTKRSREFRARNAENASVALQQNCNGEKEIEIESEIESESEKEKEEEREKDTSTTTTTTSIDREEAPPVVVVGEGLSSSEGKRAENEVFRAAAAAGFPNTKATREKLAELLARYGSEMLLRGISASVDHGKPYLSYLKGCLANMSGERKQEKKTDNPYLKMLIEEGYETE